MMMRAGEQKKADKTKGNVMSEQAAVARPDTAFWVIGVVSLIWYLIGLFMFYTGITATPEQLAEAMTPEQVAVVTATPAWAHAATAIAVLAGVLASILLLMRNKLAVPLFAISLAAAVVQDIYIFFMSDSLAAFGKQPIIIQGLVLIIGAFMFRYSRSKRAQGLLT
jgi:hypothetical protein